MTLVATLMAWFWLPETVHRAAAGTGMPFRNLAEMMRRPGLRRMLWIDFIYWFAFAIFQTTFALFVARRFGFDVSQTGYFFAAFGVLGAVVQGGFIRPIVHRLGDKPTFILGLVCAAIGLVGATMAHIGDAVHASRSCRWRSASGSAIRRCRRWSAARAAHDEQGRVQGAAGAMESLGARWGRCGATRRCSDSATAMPYLSAAGCLALTLVLSLSYTVTDTRISV